MKQKIIISIAIAAAVIGCLGVYGAVMAANADGGNYPPFMQKLAEKFNLNVSDLQKFFDENRPEKIEPGKNLDQAVKDGKITAEQKALILAKREEIKTQMDTSRTDLEAWAKANNIDLKYVMAGRGFGHKGPGGCGMRGNLPVAPSDGE